MKAVLHVNSLSGQDALSFTVSKIREQIEKGKKSVEVAILLKSLLRGIDGRDWEAVFKRVFQYVNSNFRYKYDINGLETLHSFQKLLFTRAGDCDDFTILLGTLFEACGYPTQIVLVSLAQNAPFHHVFIRVNNKLGQWYIFDPAYSFDLGTKKRRVFSGKRYPCKVYKYWIEGGLRDDESLGGFFSSITKAVSSAAKAVTNTVSKAVSTATSIVKDVTDSIGDIVDKIPGANILVEVAKITVPQIGMIQTGLNFISNPVQFMQDPLGSFKNLALSAVPDNIKNLANTAISIAQDPSKLLDPKELAGIAYNNMVPEDIRKQVQNVSKLYEIAKNPQNIIKMVAGEFAMAIPDSLQNQFNQLKGLYNTGVDIVSKAQNFANQLQDNLKNQSLSLIKDATQTLLEAQKETQKYVNSAYQDLAKDYTNQLKLDRISTICGEVVEATKENLAKTEGELLKEFLGKSEAFKKWDKKTRIKNIVKALTGVELADGAFQFSQFNDQLKDPNGKSIFEVYYAHSLFKENIQKKLEAKKDELLKKATEKGKELENVVKEKIAVEKKEKTRYFVFDEDTKKALQVLVSNSNSNQSVSGSKDKLTASYQSPFDFDEIEKKLKAV